MSSKSSRDVQLHYFRKFGPRMYILVRGFFRVHVYLESSLETCPYLEYCVQGFISRLQGTDCCEALLNTSEQMIISTRCEIAQESRANMLAEYPIDRCSFERWLKLPFPWLRPTS